MRKFSYILAAVAVIVVVYSLLFGIQTMVVFHMWIRWIGEPELKVSPVPLNLESNPRQIGATLSYYGYSFKVPWKKTKKEDKADWATQVYFPYGEAVIVFNPKKRVNRKQAFLEDLSQPEKNNIMQMFGTRTLESNYSFLKSILEITPSKLTPLTSRNKAVRDSILLGFKWMTVTTGETGIYSFDQPGYRGFQLGIPPEAEKVFLHIFDDRDREVQVLVFVSKGHDVDLSQDAINCILKTFKRDH